MTELKYPVINPNSQNQISNSVALEEIHSEKQIHFMIKSTNSNLTILKQKRRGLSLHPAMSTDLQRLFFTC